MRKIIWIVAVLLLLGFATSLLSSFSAPSYKEPSVNNPSGGGTVTPPGDNSGGNSNVNTIDFLAGKNVFLNSTIFADDNSLILRNKSVSSLYENKGNYLWLEDPYTSECENLAEDHYVEFEFLNHYSGVYSFEFVVQSEFAIPNLSNYIKSSGELNTIMLDSFGPNTEHKVTYSNGEAWQYYVKYCLMFDFDTDYMSLTTTNVVGDYEIEIFDISSLSPESFGGTLKNIQFRYCIPKGGSCVSVQKIQFNDFSLKYHPNGTSILPDDLLVEHPGYPVEGDYEILAQDSSMSFATGTSYNVAGQTVTTNYLLTDYTWSNPSTFTYTDTGTGKYGENAFNIHLPNFESGTYVFTMDMIVKGSGSKFYPTMANVFLKTPGYLNVTGLGTVDDSIVTLASFFGYDFKTADGGKFTIQLIFDFDNDILYANLIDVNGRSYSLSEKSLATYRSYTDRDTGTVVNTKNLPITLRLQVPPGVSVNKNHTSISFADWTYKKKTNI